MNELKYVTLRACGSAYSWTGSIFTDQSHETRLLYDSSVYEMPLLKSIALKRGFQCLYLLLEPYTITFSSHIRH